MLLRLEGPEHSYLSSINLRLLTYIDNQQCKFKKKCYIFLIFQMFSKQIIPRFLLTTSFVTTSLICLLNVHALTYCRVLPLSWPMHVDSTTLYVHVAISEK